MAFTDFKSQAHVQEEYQIKYIEEDFLKMLPVQPSQHFIEDYEFKNDNFDIFGSEASRCENVIYPILLEVCKKFVNKLKKSVISHNASSSRQKLVSLFSKDSRCEGCNIITRFTFQPKNHTMIDQQSSLKNILAILYVKNLP